MGIVLARSCTLSAVRGRLAPVCPRHAHPLSPRRRDGSRGAEAHRGNKRPQWEVEAGVASRLHGGITHGQGTPMALALEARS